MSKKQKPIQKQPEKREPKEMASPVVAEKNESKKATAPYGVVAEGNNFPLSQWITGKELYLFLGAVVLSCIIVFIDFIDLKNVFLYKDIGSDSINIFFPSIAHTSDYLKNNGFMTWTFAQGMGQNMFPLSIGDFFSNILTLFDKEKIPYLIGYMEVFKIILCGFVFYKYLLELKIDKYAASISAFLYAFCGFVVIGTCWTIFSLEALYVAIMLFGFERWLNRGKWLWFVVGIACIGLVQPFFLFMYTILLALYIPVRYNDVRPDEWKKFPLFLAKTLGLSVLAVAITSFQLFPDIIQYMESPRVGGAATLITKLKAQPMFGISNDVLRFTTAFRAFGSDMLGTGNDFMADFMPRRTDGFNWQNYLEAPVFYCGILSLVAFPQVFSSLSKTQKIAWGIFLGLFALPIFFPYFRYAFWAFTGDYFRSFSFVITLLMVICTAKALHYIITSGKINFWVLGGTVLVLLFLLYTPAADFADSVNQNLRSIVTFLVIIYAALLYGLSRKDNFKNISMVAMVVFCFIEIVYCSSTTVNTRKWDQPNHTTVDAVVSSEELKDKVGYNDYSVDAVKYIKEHDKNFFRIEKDFRSGSAMHASTNDNQAQGYFGTQSYFSFNQINYIKFLADLNIIDPSNELDTRWARGLIQRPLLFSIASGKYFLSKQPQNYLVNFGYDSINTFGITDVSKNIYPVKVFKNRYALPLGYTYDHYITDSEFKKLSNMQKDIMLFRGCVLETKDKALLPANAQLTANDSTTQFSFDLINQYVNQLRQDTLKITSFKESDIQGTITLTQPKVLFFSIPFDDGWKLRVNNVPTPLYRVNCGLTGVKLPAGKADIELYFVPRMMMTGSMVSIVALLVLVGISFVPKRKREQ